MERLMGEGSSSPCATVPPSPWIFLSHSGQQKEFVTLLYQQLQQADHHPFFDMDPIQSLVPGRDYPPPIFQACRDCKLGVVILSHEYIESLWPMLELQLLLLDPHRHVYPLFYKLQPADLSNTENLERWKRCWSQREPQWLQSMQKWQINLDIPSWPELLERLRYKSGMVRMSGTVRMSGQYSNDLEYIHAIVDSICSFLPPPLTYSMDDTISGHERMVKEIASHFDEQSNMPGTRVVGMYGMGGFGKSMLCKAMANHYKQEFSGKSWWLELPTDDDGNEKLLDKINFLLSYLSFHKTMVERLSTIEEAMGLLAKGLERNRVFLAVDNVWSEDSQGSAGYVVAKKILSTKCMAGSKILMTSRSKEVLKTLLAYGGCNDNDTPVVVHVPSMNKEEAVKALKAYVARNIRSDLLERVVQFCLFENQCYPLFLKVKGTELKAKVRPSIDHQEWQSAVASLGVDKVKNEDQVLQVLLKSFDRLSPVLQNVFTDMANCGKSRFDIRACIEWLALHRSGGISNAEELRFEIRSLEYHGLLEIYEEMSNPGVKYVRIHDLYRRAAKCRPNAAEYTFQNRMLSSVPPIDQLSQYKRVYLTEFDSVVLGSLLETSALPNLEVLAISRSKNDHMGCFKVKLGSGNVRALRALSLDTDGVQDIEGFEGVPNLVYLKVRSKSLKRIGYLGCLKKLKFLVLDKCSNLEVGALVGNGGKPCLVKFDDELPNLVVLTVTSNHFVEAVGPQADHVFPALEVIDLSGCDQLACFPDLELRNLRILDLRGCRSLKRLEGSVCSLTALTLLELRGCNVLQSIPDLSKLFMLKSLSAGGCKHLNSELKLPGNCSFRLQNLDLQDCTSLQAQSLVDISLFASAPVPPFERQLTYLDIDAAAASTKHISSLDVSGMPNLQHLEMRSFHSLCRITSLNHAVKLVLVVLRDLPSLEELSGFGAHHRSLRTLFINRCGLLAKIAGLGGLPALQSLYLFHQESLCYGTQVKAVLQKFDHEICQPASNSSLREITAPRCRVSLASVSMIASLQELIVDDHLSEIKDLWSLTTLASLQKLRINWCSSLIDICGLAVLKGLQDLHLHNCSSLTDVSSLTALTSLVKLSLVGFQSLSELPDLKHCMLLKKARIVSPLMTDDYVRQKFRDDGRCVVHQFEIIASSDEEEEKKKKEKGRKKLWITIAMILFLKMMTKKVLRRWR